MRAPNLVSSVRMLEKPLILHDRLALGRPAVGWLQHRDQHHHDDQQHENHQQWHEPTFCVVAMQGHVSCTPPPAPSSSVNRKHGQLGDTLPSVRCQPRSKPYTPLKPLTKRSPLGVGQGEILRNGTVLEDEIRSVEGPDARRGQARRNRPLSTSRSLEERHGNSLRHDLL